METIDLSEIPAPAPNTIDFSRVRAVLDHMPDITMIPVKDDKPMAELAIAAVGRFETHPESYFPRIFVHARESKSTYFELLKSGEAIPWGVNPDGKFDFWIVDVDRMADFGVSRADGLDKC